MKFHKIEQFKFKIHQNASSNETPNVIKTKNLPKISLFNNQTTI